MADLYLLKIGLRALVREPWEQRDYLISVLKMPATFLVMVWGWWSGSWNGPDLWSMD